MPNIPTLPGVRVTLMDVHYSANDVNPDAQRVLIIAADGTDSTADLYNPIQYFSEVQVIAACGLGSDAHIAYVQALKSGATNVFISTVDKASCATALGRESELESALAFADMVEPDLIVPFGFYANELIEGDDSDTVTLRISRVDADDDTDTIIYSIDSVTDSDANTAAVAWGRISVGDTLVVSGLTTDGVTANGSLVVVNKLGTATASPRIQCAWSTAADIDYVASSESPRATMVKTIASQPVVLSANAVNVATACYLMTRDLNPCEAVMGLVPIISVGDLPTAAEISTYEAAITKAAVVNYTSETFAPAANVMEALASVTVEGVESDLGKFIYLFAGKVIVRNQTAAEDSGTIDFTGAEAVAAGQIYSVDLDSAITSKPLANVISISNNFSRAQKLALVGAKVNPICLSSSGTIVTLDGWTLASPDEDGNESVYNRISTMRIVHEVVKATRNELEKFIGLQASTARLNSIETKLRTTYMAFKQAGILKNAEFKIEYNQTTGTLTVNLVIVPFGEMREVIVTVAVRINA